MKFYIVIFLLLLCSFAFAQMDEAWVARYNGPGNSMDTPNDIAVDADGFIYVTGVSYGSDGYEDYATIKYNPDGDTVWVARYSGPGSNTDEARAIVVDPEGNVYVTGQSKGTGTDFDCTTVKYNSDGVEQWASRYNGPDNGMDCGEALVYDDAGYVYVTGYVHINGDTNFDYLTIKYNTDGDTIWTAQYTGPGAGGGDYAYDIALDGDRNVCVTGKSEGPGNADYDFLTVKYNNEGVQQWAARYNGGGNGVDVAQAVKVDGQGNVFVAGYSWGSSQDNYDCLTVKYNPDGTRPWAARYNGPAGGADGAYDLVLDDYGNIYVCGYSNGNGTGADIVAIKYHTNASTLWVARCTSDGAAGDYGQALAVDFAGYLYVAGYTSRAPNNNDLILVQFNADGDSVWAGSYNGPGDGNEGNAALAVDNEANVILTGKSMGDGTIFDFATIKYSPRTAIEQAGISEYLPDSFNLGSYPNPFNASVRISYSVKEPAQVTLSVYNLNGQLVESLVDDYYQAGEYSVIWDGSNVATGVYLYKLDIAGQSQVKRMTLLK